MSRTLTPFILAALVICSATAQSESNKAQATSPNVQQETERFRGELASALATKDIEALQSAKTRFAVLVQTPLDPADHALRDMKLGIFLASIQSLNSACDPTFDPTQLPTSNIAPPSKKGGIQYDSGISPDAIKDPEVREEYKRLIEANRLKAEKSRFQFALHSTRNDLTIYAAQYRAKYFDSSPEDLANIKSALDTHITNAALRDELQVLLIGKKEQ